MADVGFDGNTKIITVNTGITSISVQDVYSRWKDWVLISDNAKYLQALAVIGGDPISNIQSLGTTFFLENNWQMRPDEANHVLTVDGNLFTRDGSDVFVPTIGSYQVLVNMSTSNLIDTIIAAGADANSVWSVLLTTLTTPNSVGEHVAEKVLTQNKYLALKD
jgi:hypothetical protein